MTRQEIDFEIKMLKKTLKGDINMLLIAMDEDKCTCLGLPVSKPVYQCDADLISNDLGDFLIDAIEAVSYHNEDIANAINLALMRVVIALIMSTESARRMFDDMMSGAEIAKTEIDKNNQNKLKMTKQEFDIAMNELAMQRDEVLARNIERIDQIKNEQTRLTDEHFKKMRKMDEMRRKIDGENRTARNMFNQQKLELMRQMETGVVHYEAGEVEP